MYYTVDDDLPSLKAILIIYRSSKAITLPSKIIMELPPNMKQCPACNIIIEKISGDDTMMCGCEGRPAGGTMEKALRNGGCGLEFNFQTCYLMFSCLYLSDLYEW